MCPSERKSQQHHNNQNHTRSRGGWDLGMRLLVVNRTSVSCMLHGDVDFSSLFFCCVSGSVCGYAEEHV